MYKLLLVTNIPEVKAAYSGIANWESLGFRPPHVRASAAEAMDCLGKHHADGIILGLTADEAQPLASFLMEKYPLTPVLPADDNPEDALAGLRELEQLLNRTHADYSNDPYDEAEMMRLVRHEYFRKVLMGREANPARMRRHLRLLRSRMAVDQPCVLMRLDIPPEDGYLSDHWRYGADRLEVAMRNIFGAELGGMRILISVLPDERIYLLSCPMLGEKPLQPEEMRALLEKHAAESIRHVHDYLNIDLEISHVQVLPDLTHLPEQA